MRTRWLVNLVLLLTVVGLGIAIRIEAARETTPERLAGIEPADLRLIALERQGEPRIRLERTPEGWRLREPLDADAEEAQVDKLLELLDAPVHRSFPERASARDEMGLEPPRILVRLDGLELRIGGADPVTQRRYVASDGVVHMIDDRFYAPLVAQPLDYLSRTVAPRGLAPVFGTLNGVPLAAASVQALAQARAERIEPLAGELEGEPLELKSADGSAQRFIVSPDRRRLSRLDLRVRYVLADPIALDLDPKALDPTPPAPPPAARRDGNPQALPGAPPEEASPFDPTLDPDAPVRDDQPIGAPAEVRLSPDRDRPETREEGTGFGAEPYKQPPEGFGMDPFAPDPNKAEGR